MAGHKVPSSSEPTPAYDWHVQHGLRYMNRIQSRVCADAVQPKAAATIRSAVLATHLCCNAITLTVSQRAVFVPMLRQG